jgi:hypothetical protein
VLTVKRGSHTAAPVLRAATVTLADFGQTFSPYRLNANTALRQIKNYGLRSGMRSVLTDKMSLFGQGAQGAAGRAVRWVCAYESAQGA